MAQTAFSQTECFMTSMAASRQKRKRTAQVPKITEVVWVGLEIHDGSQWDEMKFGTFRPRNLANKKSTKFMYLGKYTKDFMDPMG